MLSRTPTSPPIDCGAVVRAPVGDGQVGLSVTVQVPERNRGRPGARREAHGRQECAASAVEEDAHALIVHHGQVGLSVAVQIAGHDRLGVDSAAVELRRPVATRRAQEHAHAPPGRSWSATGPGAPRARADTAGAAGAGRHRVVADGEIGFAVTVQISERDEERTCVGEVLDRRAERKAAAGRARGARRRRDSSRRRPPPCSPRCR